MNTLLKAQQVLKCGFFFNLVWLMRCPRNFCCLYQLAYAKISFLTFVLLKVAEPNDTDILLLTYVYEVRHPLRLTKSLCDKTYILGTP